MKKKTKVIYFGTYSKGIGYPRTNVLINALKNECDLTETHYPVWISPTDKTNATKNPIKYFFKFLQAWFFLITQADTIKNGKILIVGYPGYLDIFLAHLLITLTGSSATIYYDYFFSIYESLTEERALVKKKSILGYLIKTIDKIGLNLADKIIIDTDEHGEFIAQLHRISKNKFITIPVGEDPDLFSYQPYPQTKTPFNVLYFGTLLNLHGIYFILEVAKYLEKTNPNIKFIMIGKGPNENKIFNSKLSNIEFINKFLPPEQLLPYIKQSHIVLGIFGKNKRSEMVIPCKIYDALTCSRAIITKKSKVNKMLLDKKHPFLFEVEKFDDMTTILKQLEATPLNELKTISQNAYLMSKKINSHSKIVETLFS